VAWSEVRKRHNQDHRRHDPGLQRSHNFLNTTLAPTPVAWSGVGCPIAYVAGTAYLGGSTVWLELWSMSARLVPPVAGVL